jgi:hypothetical protein
MAHITLSQLTTVLQRIVSWTTNKYTSKIADADILDSSQWPRMIIWDVTTVNPQDVDVTVGEMKISRLDGIFPVLSMYKRSQALNQFVWVEIGQPVPGWHYFDKKTSKYYRYEPNGSFVNITDQVNADWNASSGVAQILNKPTILSQQQVAGMIEDAIEDMPTGDIPTKVSELENDEGFIKASQMDNAPTAGSNNPVKSGGIKTAMDNLLQNLTIGSNGNWFVGQTDTNVKAQGPAGNVNISDASQLVTILVNDLTTGGAGNILSAEMGKVLKTAISTLIDSMGEYCFPNGRPTLSWEGAKCNVTQTLTDVTSNFAPSRVDKNSSLEITLSPVDNLHVFLTGDVTVEMGGTDITSTAWNESTGKVTIADVTDDVVITAKSSTYVSRGLVMHLDGKNRGGTAGKWKSLVDYNSNDLYFKLENCDEQSDYVAGNGTSSIGTAFSNSALTTPVTLLDVGATEGTIEAAYSHAEIASNGNLPIMHNGFGSGNRICLTSWHGSNIQDSENFLVMCTSQVSGERLTGMSKVYSMSSINAGGYISLKQGSFMLNGTTVAAERTENQTTTEESKLSIFYRRTSNDQFAKYRLYALRVYSVQLTDAERAQNLAIDQKRFNLD